MAVKKLFGQHTSSAKAAGRGLNTRIQAMGDGAEWIASQAQQMLEPERFLVDFFHVCQYLGAAESSCAENSRWLHTQKNRLKNNRADKVLHDLKEHLEPETVADEQAPVRKAHRYIKNRLQQLDYKGAIEEHLPIGTVAIESAHKHVIQQRLKIPGASWKLNNAAALAAARTIRANNMWDQYWNN